MKTKQKYVALLKPSSFKISHFAFLILSGLMIASFVAHFLIPVYSADAAGKIFQQQTPSGFFTSPALSSGDSGVSAGGTKPTLPDFKIGEVIVKFKNPNYALEAVNKRTSKGVVNISGLPKFSGILDKYGVRQAERFFHNPKNSSLDSIIKLTSPLKDREGTLAFIEALKSDPAVLYAEPNIVMKTQFSPNDTYASSSGAWGQSFRDLWGLQNINAENAWDVSQGNGVVVGISDTGIDYNHSDIANNLWINPGETGLDSQGRDKKTNGVDDDGNGYVDDWKGWNFVSNNNNPFDDFGHGTHVAGTVAATGNNGIGIVGVAPQAKVMAVKALDNNGSGYLDDLANSIIYAADNGAKVINASWGGYGDTPQTLIDAVNYAHDVKDVVFVAAAGNSNTDVGSQNYGFFPANIRNAITVSAFDHNDVKASFSNYGYKIDVAAPGGGDSIPSSAFDPFRSILSLLSSGASSAMTGSGNLIIGGNYLRQAGTSMAAPHVSGAAALLRSLHPEWNAEQIRQAIRVGSDDVAASGFETQSGYGRLDAFKALNVSSSLAVQIISPASSTIIGAENIDIRGTASGADFSNWQIDYGSGQTPATWTTISSSASPVTNGLLTSWNIDNIADGNYTIRLRAQNSSGQFFEDRVNFTIDQIMISYPPPWSVSLQTPIIRSGQPITITGNVSPVNFSSYTLEILTSANNWLSGPAITLTNGGLQKVRNGILGVWDTSGVSADMYTIYLKVNLIGGGQIWESAKVIVDPTLHVGWPKQIGSSWFSLTDHLTVADVNGDGASEIIVGYGSLVKIFDKDGNMLPGWPQSVDPNNTGALTQVSPAVGDVDRDGLPEIIASSDKVFIWHANGTLLPGWPKTIGNSSQSLAVADLNNDGTNEIIGSDLNYWDGGISVFDKNGNYLPGWPLALSGYNLSPAAIGDVNGDGKKEIVVRNSGSSGSNLYVLSFDGRILAGWPKSISGDLSYPALGDLDNDGNLDIVVGSSEGKVYAFRSDGISVSGWPQLTKSASVNTPAIGDIDGDGQPEVVAGNNTLTENNSTVNYIFAWHDNGTLLPNWPVKFDKFITGTFFGFGAVALADVDGDAKADVIASNDYSYAYGYGLSAYKSDGTEVSGFPKLSQNIGAFPTNTAAVGDIDGDGLLEIAWVDNNGNLYVWDLPGTASTSLPWPMFSHDAAHTGAFIAPPVQPDTEAPTINITGPLPGNYVSGTIVVTATSSDNVGVTKVEFYLGTSTLIGSVTSTPYSINWNSASVNDGNYTFYAKAYDAAGNIGNSPGGVVIMADNNPPNTTIFYPVQNQIVSSTITMDVRAVDSIGLAKIEIYLDGNFLGTATSSPYNFIWDTTTASNNSHVLQSRAYDRVGNIATSTIINVTVYNPIDFQSPSVSIIQPISGSYASGTIALVASSSDDIGVTRVEFYRGVSTLIGSVASSPYSINWNTVSVSDGQYSLFAKAYDAAGNMGSSAGINITIDNTLSSTSISSPVQNQIVSSTITVNVLASDSIGVSKVELYLDGTLFGTKTSSPYNFIWNTVSSTNNSHTLQSKVYDNAGNIATSTIVSVIVNNVPPDTQKPVVSITKPTSGSFATSTIAINASSSDDIGVTRVEFYRGTSTSVLIGSDTSVPYSINWNTASSSDGNYNLFAKAYDAAGNTGTSTNIAVKVDNTPPLVSIISPANGARARRGSAVTISATSTDANAIRRVEFYVKGVLTCTDTTSPYSCSWTVPSGATSTYLLQARAYDIPGLKASSTAITVTSY